MAGCRATVKTVVITVIKANAIERPTRGLIARCRWMRGERRIPTPPLWQRHLQIRTGSSAVRGGHSQAWRCGKVSVMGSEGSGLDERVPLGMCADCARSSGRFRAVISRPSEPASVFTLDQVWQRDEPSDAFLLLALMSLRILSNSS